MNDRACFRVSIDEVSQDFEKFAGLARSRTFEIWDNGKVDVLLVPIEAVREWYNTLHIAAPMELLTHEERARFSQETER